MKIGGNYPWGTMGPLRARGVRTGQINHEKDCDTTWGASESYDWDFGHGYLSASGGLWRSHQDDLVGRDVTHSPMKPSSAHGRCVPTLRGRGARLRSAAVLLPLSFLVPVVAHGQDLSVRCGASSIAPIAADVHSVRSRRTDLDLDRDGQSEFESRATDATEHTAMELLELTSGLRFLVGRYEDGVGTRMYFGGLGDLPEPLAIFRDSIVRHESEETVGEVFEIYGLRNAELVRRVSLRRDCRHGQCEHQSPFFFPLADGALAVLLGTRLHVIDATPARCTLRRAPVSSWGHWHPVWSAVGDGQCHAVLRESRYLQSHLGSPVRTTDALLPATSHLDVIATVSRSAHDPLYLVRLAIAGFRREGYLRLRRNELFGPCVSLPFEERQ